MALDKAVFANTPASLAVKIGDADDAAGESDSGPMSDMAEKNQQPVHPLGMV